MAEAIEAGHRRRDGQHIALLKASDNELHFVLTSLRKDPVSTFNLHVEGVGEGSRVRTDGLENYRWEKGMFVVIIGGFEYYEKFLHGLSEAIGARDPEASVGVSGLTA